MICLKLETRDPYFNLALEEVLLKNRKDEYLLLYINDPSVIIGKHQAAHREADTRFVFSNRIPVIRRISGGGTVFHDHGNLNYTFIRDSEEGKQVDFRKYTLPVIDFLASLGVDARLEGKSDIKVNGSKISGNAEHVFRNRVLHHGTLLFNTSISLMKNSIRTDKSCYTTRAVDSNPASVMNLIDRLNGTRDMDEFSNRMIHYLARYLPHPEFIRIRSNDEEEAASLAETRYRTWEWNFAYGPEYNFSKEFFLDNKHHSCIMNVKDGIVRRCVMTGSEKLKSVSSKMTGCRHMVHDLLNFFEKETTGISEEDIFNFF